ncbi:MAG: hypothetical protein A3D65_06265 [Candidatus Lloydbacteria bacterium RIFCSPHIGHO2_02_FULL_50_13]|uniref:Ada DNA repair metal-binding domain-containing protein n=1 Tax=Candidatus Lloydbacteria bacterium RIFCSPHIGHO2_02_FULL_50_13 TaxID=1798661 RepID=A0A1G2D3Q9_9BACT|nr:MAG: hypothetical protein A3D65_06265 [Candidatus Lloydbacteria bacterium RIFCSPHIGHO2_02_FULL_50_13]
MWQFLKKLKNLYSHPTSNGVKVADAEFKDLPKDIFVLVLIILVGLGAFFLGRISTAERERKAELRLLQTAPEDTTGFKREGESPTVLPLNLPPTAPQEPKAGGTTTLGVSVVRGAYVASKKGEVYYLPWCGGVKLIKEENKIWFATKEDAEQKGYRPAANCKGM